MRLVTSRFVKEQCIKHLIHDLILNPVSGIYSLTDSINGGATRDRTADLLRARQALSQLSYSPRVGFSWVTTSPLIFKGFFVDWSVLMVKLPRGSEPAKAGKIRKSGGSGKI